MSRFQGSVTPVAPRGPDNADVPTVLVVDDESVVREVVVKYLRREGYRTLEAGDGDVAVALVEHEHPDLVVLDLAMPGGGGPAVLDRLRMMQGGREVPVLVYSGLSRDRFDELVAFAAHVRDVHALVLAGHFGQRDQFVSVGIKGWRVDE